MTWPHLLPFPLEPGSSALAMCKFLLLPCSFILSPAALAWPDFGISKRKLPKVTWHSKAIWFSGRYLLPLSFILIDLVSPKNITDSLKATFKRRPGRLHVYQQSMMLVMLVSMMAGRGEGYCEFMYTKRLFQWKMETYSYFSMIKVQSR